MSGVLLKRRNLDTDTHPGKHDVQMKAEVGVMCLQAKEHQRWPVNYQKLGERPGVGSPQSPQMEPTCQRLAPQIGLQNWEMIHVCW